MTYECICAHRQRLTLEEAFELADAKATLEWIPVVKAQVDPDPILVLAEAMKASMDRPPAVITVNPAPVTIEKGAIEVHPSDVHVAPPEINVTIPPAKAGTKRIVKGDDGAYTLTEE